VKKVRFLQVRDEDTAQVGGLVVSTDTGVYRWIANFREWVWDGAAGQRLFTWYENDEFEEITPDEAAVLVETLPRYDGRRFKWLLDGFRRETLRLSCADLGLNVRLPLRRPTADGQLVQALRDAPAGVWVSMRLFPADKKVAARKWVSEVRLGMIKRLAPLGTLEAHLVVLDDGWLEARVRRTVADDAVIELARSLAVRAHEGQLDSERERLTRKYRRMGRLLSGTT
jgi:hypothetical protein